MDNSLKEIIVKRIERTLKNLAKNNMEVYFVKSKEEVPEKVKELINEGDIVANGGTITMKECGVTELLKSGKYKYLDRESVEPSEIKNLYRASFSADAYITSANAITEDGCLYNVDGNSNRIACIAYGPEKVIVIAGYNKIVANLDEAVKRVKRISAPANCIRLNIDSYCRNMGKCMSEQNSNACITDGCKSDCRICCNYLISAHQREKGRIKVIIVGETLGY